MKPWQLALIGASGCGLAAIGWVQWQAARTPAPRLHLSGTTQPALSSAVARIPSQRTTVTQPGCPMPALTGDGQLPLQTPVPAGMRPFVLPLGQAEPLAGFSVDARVLSRRDYSGDRPARFAPIDLALGWGAMTDSVVLAQLNVRQSNRWYRYGWVGEPPLPPATIIRSSANMHMVPAGPTVEAALRDIKQNEFVRIDGWLVEIHDKSGWNWRSSTTREDTGDGGCEIIYVCAVTR